MGDRTTAIVNFYHALSTDGFTAKSIQLIARDVPKEYNRKLTALCHIPKYVSVFESREDIHDICRIEEERLQKMTGDPKKIHDENVAAVFVYDNRFGLVPDEPYSCKRWSRYFNMDTDAPCIICLEKSKKKTICSNCTSVVCLSCDKKMEDDVCKGCTLVMGSFDA